MKTKCLAIVLLFLPLEIVFSEAGLKGLTFEGAAQMAIGASTELKNSYALHGVSEKIWALGKRAFFPKLTLTAFDDERLSKWSEDSFSKNYAVGLDQLVFDGGRLLSARKIEKARLSFEEKQIERKVREIADTALGAYRNVLASRMMLEIRQNGLVSLLEQRKVMEIEVGLGMALAQDLTEADINIAQEKIEIINLEIELDEIEKQFAESLGLETLPELKEQIDVDYAPVLPSSELVCNAAQARNSDLQTALLSIKQKEEEVKFAHLSWLPTVHASGNFSLTGNRYPLSHYNWSVGVTIELATPWISANTAGSTGFEDRDKQTFRLQGTSVLVPDPVSSMTPRQALIALNAEQANYDLMFERMRRTALIAVEKCRSSDKKKNLAIESKNLAAKKLEISKLKHDLGQLTSIDLMEDQIEYTKKEIGMIQALIELMSVEQELEKLIDMDTADLRGK
jgi:outer membrane protein TolC